MSLPQDKIKKKLIELANDNPLVSFLCHKVGIARSTFYRWTKEDKGFEDQFSEAQKIGRLSISDLAESRILSLSKSDKENISLNASKYILDHNSPIYKKTSYSHQILELKSRDTKLIEKMLDEIKALSLNGDQKNNENEKLTDTVGTESEIDKSSITHQEDREPVSI